MLPLERGPEPSPVREGERSPGSMSNRNTGVLAAAWLTLALAGAHSAGAAPVGKKPALKPATKPGAAKPAASPAGDPAAAVEKLGGDVQEIAQNDDHLDVSLRLQSSVTDAQ